MSSIASHQIQRILIRSANWVGDAIMTTPALRAIRRNFPEAHITLLAKPWVAPVFENNPHLDEIMIYQASGRHQGYAGLWRLAKDLRQGKFDLAVLFQNAFEAALIAFLARIPRRLGYTTDGRTALLNQRVRSWRRLKKGHLIDYYLGLVAGAGMRLDGHALTLEITDSEQAIALQLLRDRGLAETQMIVGINPGATYGTAKRWLPERFAQLGRRLIEQYQAGIIIFGSDAEAPLGQQLATQIGPGSLNLCGQTSLREAMALIGQCNLFVTNDSGLMHVAAALNIPQVAIIGPTDVVATGPSNARSRMVRMAQVCDRSPCMEAHCPIDHRCMNAVSVDHVMDAAMALLNEEASR